MISDEILKKEFIVNTISGALNKVQNVQIAIAQSGNKTSDALFDMKEIQKQVSSQSLAIYGSGTHFMFSIQISKLLRFADMRKLGNLKIYNKRIWGQLYAETLPILNAGISDELRTKMGEELKNNGDLLNNK